MKARRLAALVIMVVAVIAPAVWPSPVCAGDGMTPGCALAAGKGSPEDDVLAVAMEIVGIAVTVCAAILAVTIALGAFEGQLGAMFSIPGVQATVQGRIVMATLALMGAVVAVPLANGLTEIMSP